MRQQFAPALPAIWVLAPEIVPVHLDRAWRPADRPIADALPIAPQDFQISVPAEDAAEGLSSEFGFEEVFGALLDFADPRVPVCDRLLPSSYKAIALEIHVIRVSHWRLHEVRCPGNDYCGIGDLRIAVRRHASELPNLIASYLSSMGEENPGQKNIFRFRTLNCKVRPWGTEVAGQ